MEHNKIQGFIAIIVISIFMIVSGTIAIYTYANDLRGVVDDNVTSVHLKEYFSLFTGIIGIIIGFYFGKSSKN